MTRKNPPTAPAGAVAKDRRGASTIELALVCPVFLLLMLGMIDASRMVAARLHVEQAAQRTAEYALAVKPRSNNGAYLTAEAVHASGEPASNIDVEIFLECDDQRQASYTSVCPAGQHSARFVSVSIETEYEPMFDWASLSRLFGIRIFPDSIRMTGDSLVRMQ